MVLSLEFLQSIFVLAAVILNVLSSKVSFPYQKRIQMIIEMALYRNVIAIGVGKKWILKNGMMRMIVELFQRVGMSITNTIQMAF